LKPALRSRTQKRRDQQLITNDGGYKRIHDIVQSAEVFNAKHMLQTIVSHFSLQWDNDMELVFKTWQRARNPSVHQSKYATRSEDDLKEISLAESRIAGAINILLLKLFGYSGYIRHSAFEDGYRQI
jgi:aromatic ring hydroxylase